MKNLIKQLRPIIVIVITLIVGLPVLAHDFEVDGIYMISLMELTKLLKWHIKGILTVVIQTNTLEIL